MVARILNALFGVWVFFSAFAWPHTSVQLVNTALCGVACVGFAVAAVFSERARYLNAGLGAWLFVSTFLLPTLNRFTLWNNAVLGIAIFATGLLGAGPREVRRHRDAYRGA